MIAAAEEAAAARAVAAAPGAAVFSCLAFQVDAKGLKLNGSHFIIMNPSDLLDSAAQLS